MPMNQSIDSTSTRPMAGIAGTAFNVAARMASSKDASHDATGHKFPWQQLTVLAICRLAEPVAFMSVIAYIYVYTQDIRHTVDDAAFYAGLLVSAFAVAEMMTAMQWGIISDKYGRKPVVLFALAGTAVSNLVFGFATNYWVAMGSRFLGGLLNGNVAVMQTMVAEMCKKPEHEPRAYSMIPFVWSVGSILGAAMGGFLAKPSESWPEIFPGDGIFGKFPYLLPNVVSVAYLFVAVILGIVFLEETNDHAISLFGRKATVSAESDEQTPLLVDGENLTHDGNVHSKQARRSSFLASNEPVTAAIPVDLRRLSSITTEDDKPRDTTFGTQSVGEEVTDHKWSLEMVLLVAQLTLMSYHSMGFGSLLPPFLVDEPRRRGFDTQGGLGYTLRDVGGYMAANGVIGMFTQIVVFPPFVARVGVWKSFFWLTIFCPAPYLVIPFLTVLSHSIVPYGIYANLVLQSFFPIVIFPCLLILLKNATPSTSMLGQVNGLAMAACSGARTIAPPLVGAIYSHGGSAVGWWSVAVFAGCAGSLLFFMSRPQEKIEANPCDEGV